MLYHYYLTLLDIGLPCSSCITDGTLENECGVRRMYGSMDGLGWGCLGRTEHPRLEMATDSVPTETRIQTLVPEIFQLPVQLLWL
jgi:hypothetical protein